MGNIPSDQTVYDAHSTRKLDPHQVEGYRFIRQRKSVAGLFFAPGTGKTWVAILAAKRHIPALILCRRDDYLTWVTELRLCNVPPSCIKQVESSNDELADTPAAWTLVTWDLMRNKRIREWIRESPFKFVIGDELHVIKRWQAARTRNAIRATRHIPRRIGLTGTPLTNHACMDVFSECYFIDDGKLFGQSWWHHRNRYFVQDPSTSAIYPLRGAKEQIKRKLARLAMYVHEDDVLKLPPSRRVMKSVPMSGMQRRHYENILADWETQLLSRSGDYVEVSYIIAQIQKLRQIAGGFLYHPDGTATFLRCRKRYLLISLLQDVDYLGNKPKIIIWAAFRGELRMICDEIHRRRLGGQVQFFGDMPPRAREDARRAFRDDKDVRFFIGQADRGVGMNELVVADSAVWYSNSDKVLSRQQSERRHRRRGSERHKEVFYYDLVTEGTIDLKLARGLRRNMSIAEEILSGLKRGKKLRELL